MFRRLLSPSRLAGMASLSTAAGLFSGYTLSHAEESSTSEPKVALSKKEFRSFKVFQTTPLSSNTALIRVQLPSDTKLGLTVASCLSITAEIDGQTVGRPYTPCSAADTLGYAEFVIKAYPPREDGKPGGMGRHLTSLKVGDEIQMKGPWKKYGYVANDFKHLGMICGGTGLTPMYQVVQAILNNPEDDTKVSMLYANRTEEDILLKDRLDALAAQHPEQFRVTYTLDTADEKWQGETGYVTQAMVERCLFTSSEDGAQIFVCGPPPMMKAVSGNKTEKKKQGELAGCLKVCGFTSDNVFKF